MAGIYLHTPFCKQACHYCDFHFSTSTRHRTDMVAAMERELMLQQAYLAGETVDTIYFGGGTPSLLTTTEILRLLNAIHQSFSVASNPEVTLEANPDDLNRDKLMELRTGGINRLSIGIQSFYEPHLKYLNRAHGAEEAVRSVKDAQSVGFDNISVDLIYAIPAEDHRIWRADLQRAVNLHPTHVSAYCLTIEPKTVFGRWQQQGRLRAVSDAFAAEQFDLLNDTLNTAGYEAYEVSNFCQPGGYSRHNTSYWQGKKYLGIGPSAHSFDGESRQYNVAHNARYLRALRQDQVPYEREVLSRADQVNELIMTGLRTQWGCDLEQLRVRYQYDLYQTHTAYIDTLVDSGRARMKADRLQLTRAGKLWADGIAQELFLLSTE